MIKKYDEGMGQDDCKIQKPYNRTESYAECKNKSETSINRSSWNHLQMIQKICEQLIWKGHYANTLQINFVKVQNIYREK